MLLTKPQTAAGEGGIVRLISASKNPKIQGYDLFINPHAFYSDHFDDKRLSGFDPYVQGTIYGYMHRTLDLFSQIITESMQDNRFFERGLSVVVSCSSGQRCSIAVVEILAKLLTTNQVKVKIIHEMEQKWLKF